MTLFILAVAVVFVSTGVCALVEAALYAVPRPYVRQLAESGHRSGLLLNQFKEKMDYPISAILIFDTLLGVGGAAIAGSQARGLYGPQAVIWFSIGLAAALLLISQIIPKILGVVYSKPVARFSAIPISSAISVLYPVVWLIERFTRHLKPEEPPQRASEEEVKQMAQISAEEGSILGVEAELIQNSLRLNDVLAAQIMTPRQQVRSLSADMPVKMAFANFSDRALTQIPVYRPGNKSRWIGVVTSRDILSEMAKDHHDVILDSIARPFYFVSDTTAGHILLDAFLKRRASLFGVRDRNGDQVGVVSLTDVIEEIIGTELEDKAF